MWLIFFRDFVTVSYLGVIRYDITCLLSFEQLINDLLASLRIKNIFLQKVIKLSDTYNILTKIIYTKYKMSQGLPLNYKNEYI